MKKLHNKDANCTQMKPEGGLQASLCSNEVQSCSTPLGFINSNSISEEALLDYLADILVDAFLDHKKTNANATLKKCSDILPSLN
ncbi:MAG: hypothetical protein FGM57_03905 [Candidatus Taylorbacteria bacterium]|nr:hypothetical protein [Candidatus Taylorbacteria bacterium]